MGLETMENLVYLIGIALALGGLGIFGLFWSIRSSQYSDMNGAANRILYDDDFEGTPKTPAE
jgi:cbb3-type cytochrome oxidase maturation protein